MARKDESLGPNLSVVLLAGLLTFILGAVLGVASLVSQPVTSLTRSPNPDSVDPGDVVFVRGDRAGRTAWRNKEEAWRQERVDRLILTESELNQWSEERLEMPPAESEEAGWTDKFNVTVEPVNFNIIEDRVQLATQVKLPNLFPNMAFHYQVIGHFKSIPDGVIFVPEEGALGQAPLGSIPVTREILYEFIQKQYHQLDAAEWLADALEETESIEVSEDRLILQRKSRG